MTSRLGTTEYYRWDIKSLDTVSIYNLRILDKGAFKMEESHCFTNHYPVSWFMAQNVANKGLSLKDVEKDENPLPKDEGEAASATSVSLVPTIYGRILATSMHSSIS